MPRAQRYFVDDERRGATPGSKPAIFWRGRWRSPATRSSKRATCGIRPPALYQRSLWVSQRRRLGSRDHCRAAPIAARGWRRASHARPASALAISSGLAYLANSRSMRAVMLCPVGAISSAGRSLSWMPAYTTMPARAAAASSCSSSPASPRLVTSPARRCGPRWRRAGAGWPVTSRAGHDQHRDVVDDAGASCIPHQPRQPRHRPSCAETGPQPVLAMLISAIAASDRQTGTLKSPRMLRRQ